MFYLEALYCSTYRPDYSKILNTNFISLNLPETIKLSL